MASISTKLSTSNLDQRITHGSIYSTGAREFRFAPFRYS